MIHLACLTLNLISSNTVKKFENQSYDLLLDAVSVALLDMGTILCGTSEGHKCTVMFIVLIQKAKLIFRFTAI